MKSFTVPLMPACLPLVHRFPAVFAGAVLFCSLGMARTAGAQITVDTPIPAQTVVTVDTRTPGHAIPRTLFGTFLEPIGDSTYNGLWAELLRNPSLEPGLWSAENVRHLLAEEPSLGTSSGLGLPLPWEPLDAGEGNRYEPRRGDAANSFVSLTLLGLPDKPVGLRQKVYLPAREQQYVATLYARTPGPDVRLHVALRRRNQPAAELAGADTAVHGTAWTKYTVTLQIPKDALEALEPADFVVAMNGAEQVEVDQLSLLPADNLDGLDPEVVAMVRALHTPLIRFGGNFTSGYHWRDGVGPRDKRVSMLNVAWGIPELNTFGTDEFLHFCDLVDAKPQVALNLGSGSPQEAAEWVKYINEDPAWKAHGTGQLWELGNELWGNWNTGWPTLAQLAPRTLAFSQAVKAADPKARLIGTGQDPDHFETWNAAQLANPAGTVQLLSTHFVVTMDDTTWRGATPEFRTAAGLALPVQLGRQFDAMTRQIAAAGQAATTRLAFTEWLWAGHGGRDNRVPSFTNFAGALVTAGNFNTLLTHSDQVPVSDMTGVLEFAGIWKRRGVVYGTPSSYVFAMYASADADHLLSSNVTGGAYTVHNGVSRLPEIAHVPYLDVTAVAGKDGRTITLFAINRSLGQPVAAELQVPGVRKGSPAEVTAMTAEDLWAVNNEAQPQAIVPVSHTVPASDHLRYTFPPASVTRIVLHTAR